MMSGKTMECECLYHELATSGLSSLLEFQRFFYLFIYLFWSGFVFSLEGKKSRVRIDLSRYGYRVSLVAILQPQPIELKF